MYGLTRYLIFAAVAFPFAAAAWGAKPAETPERVAFTPGQTVVVKLHRGLGPRIVGEVVANDVDNLVVEHKSGERVAVDWDSIRLIKPKRDSGLWIGMAAGLALAGAGLWAEGDSLEPMSAVFLGTGAASGAVLSDAFMDRDGPLYEAPASESANR